MTRWNVVKTSLPNDSGSPPPMIADIDIWRCAQLCINNYGDEAAMEAATMADDFLSKGNIEAQRVWMRIAKAIDELRTVKPGEARN
jgi:hypothetical protein